MVNSTTNGNPQLEEKKELWNARSGMIVTRKGLGSGSSGSCAACATLIRLPVLLVVIRRSTSTSHWFTRIWDPLAIKDRKCRPGEKRTMPVAVCIPASKMSPGKRRSSSLSKRRYLQRLLRMLTKSYRGEVVGIRLLTTVGRT